MKPKPANILLIITDQQSADAVSHEIGPAHIRTPAMDSIAAQGLKFSRAYCSHPLCVPSRTAMFSGRYPHETGVMTNDDLGRDMTAVPCVGAILRDAGYDTGFVGKWHMPYPLSKSDMHGFRFTSNNICNGADIMNSDLAAGFLREKRDSPFFLVVSYNNPHNICEWARGKRGALPDGQINDPPSESMLPPLRANWRPQVNEPDAVALLRRSYQASPTFPVGGFSEREWREYQWAYYRMTECVDGHTARLLSTLDSSGLRENTAVIFLSDHGDAQGSHLWNQKTVLIDESARVPCFISFPDRVSPGVSSELTQTGIDLAPTLCDLAGIPAQQYMSGRSMLKAGRDDKNKPVRKFIVTHTRFIQGASIDGDIPVIEGRMVRSDRFKYCAYDRGTRRESLVDMQADPGETVNLADDPIHRDDLERHRRYLAGFSRQFHDVFPVP